MRWRRRGELPDTTLPTDGPTSGLVHSNEAIAGDAHGAAESDDVLLVDVHPTSLLLCDGKGRPVYPVASEEHRRAIDEIVATFNARIEFTTGVAAKYHSDADENVAVVDERLASAGELYAHLTGRTYTVHRSLEEVFCTGGEPPSVIVVPTERLDDSALRLIHDASDGPPIGIIPLPLESSADALALVLVRAAASGLRGAAEIREVHVWSDVSVGRLDEMGRTLFGSQADVDELEWAFAANSAVMTLFGHSNGVCAPVGVGNFVCSQRGRTLPEHAEDGHAPACRHAGFCYRVEQPIDRARQESRLISPSLLRSRVLLWFTCTGILPHDRVFDRKWGLGSRLARSPQVGALVTTWSIATLRHDYLSAIVDRLVLGSSIGEALHAAGREMEGQWGSRLCLLGDPRTTPFREPRPPEPPLVTVMTYGTDSYVTQHRSESAYGDDPYGMRMIELSASMTVQEPEPSTDTPNMVRRARDLCSSAQTALDTVQSVRKKRDPTPTEIRSMLVSGAQFVCRRGPVKTSEHWLRHTLSLSPRTGPVCACGGETDELSAALEYGAHRVMRICGACARAEDSEISIRPFLDIVVGEDRLTLGGWEPVGEWIGMVRVTNFVDCEEWMGEWPRAGDGMPAGEYAVSGSRWPKGPVRIHAAFLEARGMAAIGVDVCL